MEMWKIHWILKYLESQYCFANISATKAWIFMKIFMVANYYLVSLSFKFHKDPCIRWGDIQLLVTMYISYYTLNYSQFSTENFDFFGTPSYWYFLISSFPWQFLTRRKKPHAILINTERVRSPRVQTFWWHSSNRDSRPGEFQPYGNGMWYHDIWLHNNFCYDIWSHGIWGHDI